MLEQIEIKNYQSHLNTKLILHKGVNAITGESAKGKSSICRAVELLVNNKPRGYAYRTFEYLKPKGPTEVSLTIDGVTAKRIKSKKINQYTLSTEEEPFNVVGINVPNRIEQFLNFDEITIQEQHAKYFLIQDTPGEVAKKLNKVAGLEIIDHVLKSVKSAITKNITDIKYTNDYDIELENEIKQYKHLDAVEEQLNILQSMINTFQEKDKLCNTLLNIVNEIENINKTIVDLDGWIEIENIILPMVQDIVTLKNINKEINDFKCRLDEIDTCKTRIKTLSARADCEVIVQSISKLVSEREELLWTYNSLITTLQNIGKTEELQVNLKNNLEMQETKLNQMFKKYKVCPICGTKLTTTTIKYIKETI